MQTEVGMSALVHNESCFSNHVLRSVQSLSKTTGSAGLMMGLMLVYMERTFHFDGELRVKSRSILLLRSLNDWEPICKGGCCFIVCFHISLTFLFLLLTILTHFHLCSICPPVRRLCPKSCFPFLKKQFFPCLTSFTKNKPLNIKLLCHSKFIFYPSLYLHIFFNVPNILCSTFF